MDKKMIKSVVIGLILTLSFFTVFPYVQAASPHAVKGILYINDEIPTSSSYDFEEISVKLVFTGETYTDIVYEYNLNSDNTNYNVGLFGHEGETATIIVEYYGHEIIPEDNPTITIDTTTGYIMDLHITLPAIDNDPPNKPTNPKPENNSENISLNPNLSVFVSDPDGDDLIVSFYNASNHQLIDYVTVSNASNAEVTWQNLSYNTSYSWYVVSNDSEFEVLSDIFTFKTRDKDITPPIVSFQKPVANTLYIKNNKFLQGFLKNTWIFGKFTIIVNATDETGVDHVEILIKKIKTEKNKTYSKSSAPFSFEWNTFGFGKYNITATAYDLDQNLASTNIIVYKFF